ncbi:MAG: phage tail tape measure protein [Candidatus Deferrimicrobiaceae bacterium]
MNRLSFILKLVDRVSGPAKRAARAIERLRRGFGALGRQGSRIGGKLGQFAKKLSALGSGAINMSGQLSLASSNMRTLAQQGAGILQAPIGEFVDFEHAMSKVRALSNSTTQEFEKQTKVARELGATTIFTAKEAAEGMGYLAMAGFNAEKQIAALPAVLDLATAAGADLGRTAEISSNIMGAFGIRADEMRKASDVLAATFTRSNTTLESLGETMKYAGPNAKAAGVGLAEVAKFAAVMGNAGIDGSLAGTALRAMLQRLSAPPKAAAAALKKLGIVTQDTAGNLRSPIAILQDMNEAMKGLGSAQRTAAIGAIFGLRASAGMAEILDKLAVGADSGVVSFKELSAAIDDAAGTTDRIGKVMSEDSWGDIKKVTSAFSEFLITIGKQLRPTIREVSKAAVEWIQKATAWVKQNPELVTQIAKTVAVLSALAAAGSVVASIASAVMFGFGGLFKLLSGGWKIVQGVFKIFVWGGRAMGSVAGWVGRVSAAFYELGQFIWQAGKLLVASPIGKLLGLAGAFAGGVQIGNFLDDWLPSLFGDNNASVSTTSGGMIADLVWGERQRASGRGVGGGRGFDPNNAVGATADNRSYTYQPTVNNYIDGAKDGRDVGDATERALRRDSDRMQLQMGY